MKKNSKNYITGAAIIACGGIFSKFLGIFFKIPINNIIGSYGLGLYSYAYPLYNAFLAISTVGLPVAVSKMVSEKITLNDAYAAKKIFRVALITLATLGAFASAVMFFGAGFFIKLFSWDKNAYYCIVSLSIAPFFVAVISAYRGYFQGMQMMSVSSVSQILDQIGRVSVGVGLAYYLTNKLGVVYGAAGAVFGAVAGAIIAFVFLFFANAVFSAKNPVKKPDIYNGDTTRQILKKIIIIAVPITIGGLITTVMDLINSMTISSCLQTIGYSQTEATSLLGILEQRAQTLVNVPIILGSSLSASLVPSISSSFVLNNIKMAQKKVSMAIRIAFIVGLPCAVGLSVLAKPIIMMLFKTEEGGAMLSVLAFTAITTIAMTSLQGILQGAGKFYLPLVNLAIGAVIKYILNMLFLVEPEMNIFGAVYSSLIATAVIFVLNLIQVYRHIGFSDVFMSVIKAAASACVMGVITKIVYDKTSLVFDFRLAVIVAIIVAVIVYFGFIIASKAFTKEDFNAVRE